MKYQEIMKKLKYLSNPKNVEGMVRFGINPKNTLGISVYVIRKMAKDIGKDHELALKLWNSKIHEARMLAGFLAEPEKTNEKLMEKWVKDFDSWDVCDQVCGNLFDKTEFAYKKAVEWSKRKEEFVKRAGFVLMATLSVHDNKANDKQFEKFFPYIKKESTDERNFVKKAVNWALRQIGKRNLNLNKKAIKVAKEIKNINSKSARWIASDAIRELTSEAIQKRLKR
ncbi:MAG: DNA alkylation repair protein [Candidatus Aenigmarchaeota archaeon]|nr:DNA alkylation repair protein [Candidatus Aenigmarchaeota archaeon]